MTLEANKQLVRRFYEEVFNQGNIEAVEQFVAPDVVDHNPPPGFASGLEGAKQLFSMFHAAFSHLNVTVDDVIAEGDKVVARGMMRGVHTGSFMGIPATGKEFAVAWIDVYRVTNGKQAEVWHLEDLLTLLQQLGVIPAP